MFAWSLSVVDLAAWELPQPPHVATLGSLREQYSIVLITDYGRHDGDFSGRSGSRRHSRNRNCTRGTGQQTFQSHIHHQDTKTPREDKEPQRHRGHRESCPQMNKDSFIRKNRRSRR